MANNCFFDMKIVGKPDSVREFVQALRWEGEYENNGLGRTYSFDADISQMEKDPRPGSDLISITGCGDCAWSVLSAMTKRSGYNRTLESETERLGVCVELFSSEPGLCFQEHYIVDKGNILQDECVDYQEYWIEGYEEEDIQELLEELELTREELFSNLNANGDYCIGGFDDFGEFNDLFSYFTPERSDPTLDNQDRTAVEKEISTVSDHNMTHSENYPSNNDKNPVSLWARVGVSLEVSPETYERLVAGDRAALEDVLLGKTGSVYLSGETYFPDIEANFGLEEAEFDINPKPFVSRPDPVEVKVMIEEGIVQGVLKNKDQPINVEVVDVDVEYEDYEKLNAYKNEILKDPSFVSCDYSVSSFEVDELPTPGMNLNEQSKPKPNLDSLIGSAKSRVETVHKNQETVIER